MLTHRMTISVFIPMLWRLHFLIKTCYTLNPCERLYFNTYSIIPTIPIRQNTFQNIPEIPKAAEPCVKCLPVDMSVFGYTGRLLRSWLYFVLVATVQELKITQQEGHASTSKLIGEQKKHWYLCAKRMPLCLLCFRWFPWVYGGLNTLNPKMDDRAKFEKKGDSLRS